MTTSIVLPEELFYQLQQKSIAEQRSVSSLIRLLLSKPWSVKHEYF